MNRDLFNSILKVQKYLKEEERLEVYKTGITLYNTATEHESCFSNINQVMRFFRKHQTERIVT